MAQQRLHIAGTACNCCPNCKSTLIKIHKRRGKYKIECDGDCWTQTGWHWNLLDAFAEWDSIKPTNHEEDNI